MKKWIANWSYDQYQPGTIEVEKVGPKQTRIVRGSAAHSRYRSVVDSSELFDTEEALQAHYFPKLLNRACELEATAVVLRQIVLRGIK